MCGLDAQLDYCAEKQLEKWGEESSHKTIKAAREVIERRIKERYQCTFTEYKNKKIEPLRISLKKKQIEMALGGNVSMLIWLGKQMLGQRDQIHEEIKLDAKTENKTEIVYKTEWGGSFELPSDPAE